MAIKAVTGGISTTVLHLTKDGVVQSRELLLNEKQFGILCDGDIEAVDRLARDATQAEGSRYPEGRATKGIAIFGGEEHLILLKEKLAKAHTAGLFVKEDKEQKSEEEKGKEPVSLESRVGEHLGGSVAARHQEIDQFFKKPSLEKARDLAHRFFSGRRAYTISTDHYLLWTLLNPRKEHFALLSFLMKKMVEEQEKFFREDPKQLEPPSSDRSCNNQFYPVALPLPAASPPKSAGKKQKKGASPSPKSPSLTCYYFGGRRNWEQFRRGERDRTDQGVSYPGVRVTRESPLNTATNTAAAMQTIGHADSVALIHFTAPSSFFYPHKSSEGLYRFFSSKEVGNAQDSPLLKVEEFNGWVRRRIIKPKLTEASLQTNYPTMAPSILSVLREEGILPPPPSAPNAAPAALSSSSSSSPLSAPPPVTPPIALSSPHHLNPASAAPSSSAPSRSKSLLLLGGLAALILFLWKGGREKISLQKIKSLFSPRAKL
jgi:hypothetical protein